MATARGVRVRRTALGALVLVFCAGGGLLAAALGSGHHAASGAPGTSHAGPSAGAPAADSHLVLQVMPAPYQLPAPVTRAVALPDQRGC